MQESIYDIIILGGGPAGLTASIYTSRAMLKTLVVSGNPPGGQLMSTSEVENFPGFPAGINGPDLISNMRTQSERFGSKFTDENVLSLSGSYEDGFEVKTENGSVFKSKAVIVATGASAKWLGLESEQRLRGHGVSACATCDGFFFKDKVVAVVGGGDSGMEEATFLTKFASKVYVLIVTDEAGMTSSAIMKERAVNNPKIELMFNVEITEVLGDNSVEGLNIRNNLTGEQSVLEGVRGLFIAIGHAPNTKFLSGVLDLDETGYIKVTDLTKSSQEGIFIAGDVSDYKYRQAITASGLGCMASLDAIRFLSEKGVKVKTEGY